VSREKNIVKIKVKVMWTDRHDLTSTVEVEAETAEQAEKIAYGICGEFFFDQGGQGNMPCPSCVEAVK